MEGCVRDGVRSLLSPRKVLLKMHALGRRLDLSEPITVHSDYCCATPARPAAACVPAIISWGLSHLKYIAEMSIATYSSLELSPAYTIASKVHCQSS